MDAKPVQPVIMTQSEATSLNELQWHWEDKYAIKFADGVWSARYHGSSDLLTADDSEELRKQIRADYLHRPGPCDTGSL